MNERHRQGLAIVLRGLEAQRDALELAIAGLSAWISLGGPDSCRAVVEEGPPGAGGETAVSSPGADPTPHDSVIPVVSPAVGKGPVPIRPPAASPQSQPQSFRRGGTA